MSEDHEYEVKVVILGNSGVGKTSLISRYVYGTFTRDTISTIGASFASKRVTLDGKQIKLQIWDTAGQERFKSMTPMYYRDSSIAILVFEISNIESFEAVQTWVEELSSNVHTEGVGLFIVGNKSDLSSERQVSKELAQSYADEIQAQYMETSAKDNEGIAYLFDEVSKWVVQGIKEAINNSRRETVSLHQQKKKRSCC